jgi:ferredoxin-NADP reductase
MRIIDETDTVKTFVLAAETPTVFAYAPGQATTLHLPIDGRTMSRTYTIASSPSRPHTLAVTVKRLAPYDGSPGGVVSTWMHERVALGDTLTISGLHGSFSCTRHPSPRLLLISAGIGITPMLSMARWMSDTACEADVVLVHAARTSSDIIAHQELVALARSNPRLRLVFLTSRPEPGTGWNGPVGRITSTLLPLAVPDFLRRTVFCCGPEGFMQQVRGTLQPAGFPMAKYHEENFGSRRGPGGQSGARTALHSHI